MKKRIGNDITFTWHIYRKSGEEQVPESFAGKDVEVKLISPLQRPVTIEDVSIATGVVTFTFRGKHQVTLGNYVAVLLENKGENGMVTLDVVNAVTLVAHSYMEEDGDDGDVIEATSVELTSTISVGGSGGMVQQQADWAQTDASALDYIKNKPDLNAYLQKEYADGHGNKSFYGAGNIVLTLANEQGSVNQIGTFYAGGWSVSSPDGKFQTFGNSIYRGTMGFDHDSVVWEKTAAQQIPAATSEANGLMSASDKGKLNTLPTATQLTEELGNKANSADLAEVARSGSYNDLTDKPTIPAAQVHSDWNESDTTSKAYIKNKPTIPTVPTDVSAFNNDAGYISDDDVDDVPTANSNNPVKSSGVYGTTPSITNTDAESDLDISDEDDNVLMRLVGGHIKTKNFDSQKKNVKISYLSIGNSVNQDVAAYLPYLLKSIYGNDIDFEIGIAFIGSYTIKDYVEQVITNNKKIEKFSYANNTDVLTDYDDAFYLKDLLSLKNWNIISFQMYQANTSGTGRAEDVTLAPQLLQYLKQHCTSSCKFGLITPTTYTDVRNLYMQWQQTILTSCSLDFIFDYGATKEFLMNRGIPSSMLSTDGNHSNEGYPCITIALTAIHGIASIFNLENKASNFKERMTYAKYQTLNIPNPNGNFQTATEEQWYIGVNSAIDGSRVSKSTYIISNDSLRLQTFNN